MEFSNIFDDDFIKDVFLVLIPVVVGAILAPIITRKWQTRSEKIKTKKEMLEIFAKGYPRQNDIYNNFFGLFNRTYGKMNKDEYDFEHGSTLFEFNVPLTGERRPQILLKEEYKKMESLIENSKLNETLFQSLIEVYYRDNDFQHDFGKIAIKTGYIRNLINNLMQDQEDPEKYKKIISEFTKEHAEVNKLIANFVRKLVQSDIKIS